MIGLWRERAFLLARVVCVLVLLVFTVGVLLREGDAQVPALDIVAFNVVYVSGAAACLLRRSRGRARRWGWRLLAMAVGVATVSNLYYSVLIVPLDPEPAPSVADIFYLAWFPLTYAALVLHLRARVRRFWTSMWLDGGVVALGGAAWLGWVLGPLLSMDGESFGEIAMNLSFPLADLMLIVVLIAGAAALGAAMDRGLLGILAGLAVTGVADTWWLIDEARGGYVEGGWVDVCYLAGVAVLALAAGIRDPEDDTPPAVVQTAAARVGWRILALPAASILISLTLLTLQGSSMPIWGRVTATGCILLGLIRVAKTFSEVRDLGDVHRQARTDELTGLPNRRALYEQSEQLLAQAGPSSPVSLLLLDLNRFKEINDSLGHMAGDDLLLQVGRRVRAAVHARGLVARLGGDEFAVLLPSTDGQAARGIAEQIRRALAGGFHLDTVTLHVDASIGVAVAEAAGVTRTELLRCADVAMYEAKNAKVGVMSYANVDTGYSVDRLRTAQDLRRALRGEASGGHLLVYVQPQIQLSSGALSGVEALVRWQHPERGLLRPAAFLPAAETAGMMGVLAEAVLDLSVAACRGWWDQGHRFPISVNLCAANVHDRTLPAKIDSVLNRHAVPARALIVELTEESLMIDTGRARVVLDQIRRLGARVSIDDFGTGYSSLAYLRDLAVDEVKIDRAFTAEMGANAVAAAIVRHTVAMGHTLGLRVVAEGIEQSRTLDALAAFGCDVAQGYHLARPMPAGQLMAWMAQRDAATLTLAGGAS